MLQGYLSSMLPSELTALFLFLLLLVLVIYLINAIAFYNLAVRYGVPSPWMSFVPILNVYQTGRFINQHDHNPVCSPAGEPLEHLLHSVWSGNRLSSVLFVLFPLCTAEKAYLHDPCNLDLRTNLYPLFFEQGTQRTTEYITSEKDSSIGESFFLGFIWCSV